MMASIIRRAASIWALSRAPTVTVPTGPSPSTDTSAPVSCSMARIVLPLGPMISPTLSPGTSKLTIFGAVGPTSDRGREIASSITSRICMRASLAWASARASTSAGMPSIFVSSWRAVTKSAVPATLKSMSPKASSAPRMSVSGV